MQKKQQERVRTGRGGELLESRDEATPPLIERYQPPDTSEVLWRIGAHYVGYRGS